MPKTKNKWANAVVSQAAHRGVLPRGRASLSHVAPVSEAVVVRFEHGSAGTDDAARVDHAALTHCIRADLWP